MILFFLDVNMDELDGMETAQKIRKVSNDVFIVLLQHLLHVPLKDTA